MKNCSQSFRNKFLRIFVISFCVQWTRREQLMRLMSWLCVSNNLTNEKQKTFWTLFFCCLFEINKTECLLVRQQYKTDKFSSVRVCAGVCLRQKKRHKQNWYFSGCWWIIACWQHIFYRLHTWFLVDWVMVELFDIRLFETKRTKEIIKNAMSNSTRRRRLSNYRKCQQE